MDLMSSIIDAVAALRELPTKSAQGLAFEKLMVNFIKADPTLSGEFDEVHRWVDWPYNGGRVDTGIDLVAHNRDDGTFTAIQCKFYQPSTSLAKGQLDSFFEASGRTFDTPEGTRTFSNRLIISTTDKWSANAEEMLANQTIPTRFCYESRFNQYRITATCTVASKCTANLSKRVAHPRCCLIRLIPRSTALRRR